VFELFSPVTPQVAGEETRELAPSSYSLAENAWSSDIRHVVYGRVYGRLGGWVAKGTNCKVTFVTSAPATECSLSATRSLILAAPTEWNE
jgi:hypothetical protein